MLLHSFFGKLNKNIQRFALLVATNVRKLLLFPCPGRANLFLAAYYFQGRHHTVPVISRIAAQRLTEVDPCLFAQRANHRVLYIVILYLLQI